MSNTAYIQFVAKQVINHMKWYLLLISYNSAHRLRKRSADLKTHQRKKVIVSIVRPITQKQ